MIGQMAIAVALPELNDPGCSVREHYFSFQKHFIYNYLHVVQKWTKNRCRRYLVFSRFRGTSNPAILAIIFRLADNL